MGLSIGFRFFRSVEREFDLGLGCFTQWKVLVIQCVAGIVLNVPDLGVGLDCSGFFSQAEFVI